MFTFRRVAFAAILLLLTTAVSLGADDSAGVAWDAWERMPVFYAPAGRVMPLDTFARTIVRDFCGKEKPTLVLVGAVPDMDINGPELEPSHQLFPGGQKRRFASAELLFSWLVEADKWEYVPFLHAEHEQVRQLLGVPLRNGRGSRLKFASPFEVQQAQTHQAAFQEQLDVIAKNRQAAAARGETYEPSGLEEKVYKLQTAFNLYRRLTRGPQQVHFALVEAAHDFEQSWGELSATLEQIGQRDADFGGKFEATDAAVRTMVAELRREWFVPDRLDTATEQVQGLTEGLADHFQRQLDRLDEAPPGADAQAFERIKDTLEALIRQIRGISSTARRVREALPGFLQQFLYDDHPLRMVPDLDPDGLMVTSRNEERLVQPWLSFNAMVFGSVESFCRHVPAKDNQKAQEELGKRLSKVQKAFAEAKAAYLLPHDSPDRPADFAEAMGEFSEAVRSLGEAVEPFRRKLPFQLPEKDLDEELHGRKQKALLDVTAYPPVGAMNVEIHYNRFSPFLKSWIASLAGVFSFALSFGAIRRLMFWSGMTLLALALGLMTYALYLRFLISGWVPVTSMFESVVFVALTVSLLGLWFALVPVLWPGIRDAWQSTALPAGIRHGLFGRWYEMYKSRRFGADEPLLKPQAEEDEGAVPQELSWAATANWVLLLPRIGLMVLAFYWLVMAGLGTGGNPIIRLWPRIDSTSQIVNGLLTWTVGLCVLVPSVCYAPRLVLAFLVSLVSVPRRWADEDLREWLKEVDRRKLYAAVGAAVSCFAAIVAYYAPTDIIDPKIGTLRPALHSNFWLTIHVLPITASYGAGALAWGLSNISLAYYLFGRYREADGPATIESEGSRRRRPPEACAALARFSYRAILVAVLLLIAGTILGALWADVAWGRFWGWDSKEVWSLISILAYMIILHGRYAGWAGNFGMAVGSVLGMTSILIAWYGVNTILKGGLHSYGSATGGELEVSLFVAFNWLFLIAAAVRYNMEIGSPVIRPENLPSAASPKTESGVG